MTKYDIKNNCEKLTGDGTLMWVRIKGLKHSSQRSSADITKLCSTIFIKCYFSSLSIFWFRILTEYTVHIYLLIYIFIFKHACDKLTQCDKLHSSTSAKLNSMLDDGWNNNSRQAGHWEMTGWWEQKQTDLQKPKGWGDTTPPFSTTAAETARRFLKICLDLPDLRNLMSCMTLSWA